jgi:hypothetical protein
VSIEPPSDSPELPIDPDDEVLTRAAELSADVWRMLAELEAREDG